MAFAIGNVNDSPRIDDIGINIGGGGRNYKLYGVRFDPVLGSPGNRMYSSIGLNFTASSASSAGVDDFIGLENGNSPFGIKECATKYNASTGKQEIMAYKGDSSWSSAIADPEHNRMIEFPKFYYKRPSKLEWIVSKDPFPGSSPSPMHYRNGVMHDKWYISKYAADDNGLSQSGSLFGVNKSLDTFRTLLRSKGLFMIDYAAYCAIMMLMFIKYNSMVISNVIGLGALGNITPNGRGMTDNILGMDGHITSPSTHGSVLTFGIENIYGHYNKFLDGVVRSADRLYINTDIENITQTPTLTSLGGFTMVNTKTVTVGSNAVYDFLINDACIAYDNSVDWAIFVTDFTSGGINNINFSDIFYFTSNNSGINWVSFGSDNASYTARSLFIITAQYSGSNPFAYTTTHSSCFID